MQPGDLVKWTNPGYEDTGIALRRAGGSYVIEDQMIIYWFGRPEHSGPYRIEHEYLEVISESR